MHGFIMLVCYWWLCDHGHSVSANILLVLVIGFALFGGMRK